MTIYHVVPYLQDGCGEDYLVESRMVVGVHYRAKGRGGDEMIESVRGYGMIGGGMIASGVIKSVSERVRMCVKGYERVC